MARPLKKTLSEEDFIKSFNTPSFKPRPPSIDEEATDPIDEQPTAPDVDTEEPDIDTDDNDTPDEPDEGLNSYTPKGEPVGLDKIHPNLKKAMEDVEKYTGIKSPITSGYRSQAEQDTLDVPGKAVVSKHTEGRAIDQRIQGLSGKQIQTLLNEYNKVPGVSASVHNGTHIHLEYAGDDNQQKQLSDDEWLNQFIPPSKPPETTQPVAEPSIFDKAKNYLSSLNVPQPNQGRNYGKVGAPTREQAEPSGKLLEEFADKPLLPESISSPAGKALLAPTIPGLVMELAKPFSKTAEDIQAGTHKSLGNTLQGFSTPKNLAIAASLETPAAPFVLAGMIPGAIKGTYESGKNAYENIKAGKTPEAAQAVTDTLIQALMTGLGAKGAVDSFGKLRAPAEAPVEAPAVAEVPPKVIKASPEELDNINFSEEMARRLGATPNLENTPPVKIIKGNQEIPSEAVTEPPTATVTPQPKVIRGLPEDKIDLELQEQLYKKFGVDPYAETPPQKIIKEKTIPEAPHTLEAQVKSVDIGNSDAALITPDAPVPIIPKSLSTVDTEVGKFVYDPAKTSEGEILSKVADGTYGDMLGYVEPKSERTTQVATAETPQGQELKSAAVSPERVEDQVAFLKKQFPESNVKVGGQEQAANVLNERLKNSPLDYLKEIGRSTPVEDLKRDLKKKFLLNDERANAVAEITEARAEAWSKQTGRPKEDWYHTRIKGIERKVGDSEFSQGKIKGAVHFLEDGRAIIRAFQKADVSTAVHELGHVFRRDLEGDLLKAAEDWAGVKNGKWRVSHEERFARGFERYLREGEAPTPKLAKVFEQFKSWLSEIYKKITGSEINIKVTPQIREVFDSLLGGERGKYAVEEGVVREGSLGEHKGIDTIRETAETSGGNRPRQSGEVEQVKEETTEAIRSRLKREYKSKKVTDLLKEALPEELKTFFQEAGAKAIEREERQKIASQEILRRVNDYAKEKGLSIQETLPRMNLTPEIFNKLREIAKKEKVPLLEKQRTSPAIAETGLKTGKFVEDRPSYRADKINAPEDIQRYLKATSEKANEFREQRISKTDEGIKKLAEDVGITVEDLLKAKPGSIANAETVFKSRQLIQDLAKDLREAVKSTDMSVATPEQLNMLKEKHLRLMGAMKTVAGFRSEASNVFRQFKLKVEPREEFVLRDLMQKLKEASINTDDLEAFSKKTRELTEPTTADKLWHLWYANILSGPATHLRNLVGNASQMGMELVRIAGTKPTELPASIGGFYNGLVKGLGRAKQILKEGDFSKFEERGKLPIKFKGKWAFLNAADYVGRLLSASDSIFSKSLQGIEAGGLARDQAIKEGLFGEARKARTKELTEEKFESPEAVEYGLRNTYNQKPAGPVGVVAEYLGRITNKMPAGKLILPFTRVVANVLNNAIDWTPVGTLRALKPDLLTPEHPFKIETGRQKYQQIGRGVLGTVGMAYFATLAAQGIITGQGPREPKKKQQLMATGWRPNSVKIKDTYYPYSNWGPIALNLALVGNYFDADRYGEFDKKSLVDRMSAAVMGSAKTILDMSFLQNLSDLITSINEADKGGASYFKRFVAQQAGSAVPALFKQIDRIFDPSVYDTETLREKIQSSAHITTGLKKKLNVWGEPITGEAISGLQPVKRGNDPLKNYLADNDLWVSVPSKNTKILAPEDNLTGEKKDNYREMNRDEYYDYIKISGEMIKERLGDRLEKIQALPTKEMKQAEITKVVNAAREIAKKQVRLITLEKGEKNEK